MMIAEQDSSSAEPRQAHILRLVPKAPEEPRRQLRNLERRSFAALDLEGTESAAEIKTRYKDLVKRLHPDANGGDRSSEDKLREIIRAYNYLRSAKLA